MGDGRVNSILKEGVGDSGQTNLNFLFLLFPKGRNKPTKQMCCISLYISKRKAFVNLNTLFLIKIFYHLKKWSKMNIICKN